MSGEETAVERRASCRAAADVSDPLPLPELQNGDDFSRQNLETWVHALAAPGLRGRRAGTRDARRAARLIADYFASLGTEPPPGTDHCIPFDGGGFRDQNVVAHLPRSSKGAVCRWLLIGAHYDGLGLDERERIRPGADDNATGVAVMLEAARLFGTASRRPRIGLVLAAFGGEEQDLSGSRAYVKNPSVPLERVQMMVNLDMLGRRPGGMATIGYQASGELRHVIEGHVREASATTGVKTTLARLGDRSDSASFSAQVPTLFFSTMTHADYHQSTDTPERVDYRQVESALRLLLELAARYDCG